MLRIVLGTCGMSFIKILKNWPTLPTYTRFWMWSQILPQPTLWQIDAGDQMPSSTNLETTTKLKPQTKAQVQDWNPGEDEDPSSRLGILTVISLHFLEMPEIDLKYISAKDEPGFLTYNLT